MSYIIERLSTEELSQKIDYMLFEKTAIAKKSDPVIEKEIQYNLTALPLHIIFLYCSNRTLLNCRYMYCSSLEIMLFLAYYFNIQDLL